MDTDHDSGRTPRWRLLVAALALAAAVGRSGAQVVAPSAPPVDSCTHFACEP